MFRPSIAVTIARKELREALRDRRTLFLMVLLPILLYPMLLLLITQVAMSQQEAVEAHQSRVVYSGADATHPFVARLAADARLRLEPDPTPDDPSDPPLGDDGVDAALDLTGWPAALGDDAIGALTLAFVSVEETSRETRDRVLDHLEAHARALGEARLVSVGLDPTRVLEPVALVEVDRSSARERGGLLLSSLLPMLIIATVLLGALYPAIDVTAGEKERGTIQTLFTAPISPLEIVGGKYAAVVIIALISGGANLLSMALLFGQQALLGGLSERLDVELSLATLLWIFVAVVLIALFFAALLLTVASLARSFKDAQNITTPVYLACLVPAMVAQMPGFEFGPKMALIPGVNVILWMKEVLMKGVVPEHLFLLVAGCLVQAGLVLVVAARLYAQERIVIGARGSLRLLARGARRRPDPAEALALYALGLVLLFYVGAWLQSLTPWWGLVATLWGLVLAPPLLFAAWMRFDLRETFALRRPAWRMMAAAALLGVSAWTIVGALNGLIERHLLETPAAYAEAMLYFFTPPDSALGWVVFAFAVVVSPALCEEALFRGFIQSALRGRVAPWLAVGGAALLFGVFHLSIYRLFGTTALGLIAGWLAWRGKSLWPAVLFHALNNGCALALLALAPSLADGAAPPTWMLLAGAAGTAAGLALTRHPGAARA